MSRGLSLLLSLAAIAGLITVVQTVRRAPAEDVVLRPTPAAQQPAALSDVQVIATGLEVPWALAFAPDGALFVTERPGRLIRIRGSEKETVAVLPDVSQRAESGLLGLALDPNFAENSFVYLAYTSRQSANRVVRFTLAEHALRDPLVLLDNIPAAPFHDGGRIAFGPDGNLYVTTGDATEPERAQDRSSLAGKILRIRPDGSVPPDNPFPGSPVYSLGHRNPQGLAWAADGELYATEHGPSGVPPNCCHDEVNRIEGGKNYGWPDLVGSEEAGLAVGGRVFQLPVAESGPAETWAPAGAAIIGDTLYFGGLRGEALFALNLRDPGTVTKHFAGQFGRIRDVVAGPDGALYLTTSNRDGRGTPAADDDRILRVDPASFSRAEF